VNLRDRNWDGSLQVAKVFESSKLRGYSPSKAVLMKIKIAQFW
jgi:hypothetical protein